MRTQILVFTIGLLLGYIRGAPQTDYQDEIDQYQKLYVCAYLSKYEVDQIKSQDKQDINEKQKLRIYYKMAAHCYNNIDQITANNGFEYNPATFDVNKVNQITNKYAFLKDIANLKILQSDFEVFDMLFDVSEEEERQILKLPPVQKFNEAPKLPPDFQMFPKPPNEKIQSFADIIGKENLDIDVPQAKPVQSSSTSTTTTTKTTTTTTKPTTTTTKTTTTTTTTKASTTKAAAKKPAISTSDDNSVVKESEIQQEVPQLEQPEIDVKVNVKKEYAQGPAKPSVTSDISNLQKKKTLGMYIDEFMEYADQIVTSKYFVLVLLGIIAFLFKQNKAAPVVEQRKAKKSRKVEETESEVEEEVVDKKEQDKNKDQQAADSQKQKQAKNKKK
ncbi:UNKNOWN [Stylonychia lemnae]|uniref:Uncharacterized protein n=1 Tax=Stylonychia lemnae TaxID=5949 RepID=A0A078AQ01_STYLE|nr:UNKNOWN [Stylonychia lemnae]|eukprot:CDW84425.1 UNKNOWN [Stylonychia lemnae]